MLGTRAIIVAQHSSGRRYPSLIAPGAEPIVLDEWVMTIDALGRLITLDGTRSGGWLWERGDGTSAHTRLLCDSLTPSVHLEDGGLLCTSGLRLVRLAPEATVAFALPVTSPVNSISLDVSRRVACAPCWARASTPN